ncbi:MAG: disulfide bond formation protein B [Actinomycetota bacterium]
MDTERVSLFLALLAVVAELATLTAMVLAVGGRFSSRVANLRDQAVAAVAPSALTLAFLVAAVSMAGSLYFSEVANFPPCKLCWYQRYAMYPLVPILGIAAWRHFTPIRPYALGLAAIGSMISTYHILVERGIVKESTSCDPTNPCSLIWVERLGYLTIPTMALSGFLLILTLLAVSRAGDRLDEDPSDLLRSEVHGHH